MCPLLILCTGAVSCNDQNSYYHSFMFQRIGRDFISCWVHSAAGEEYYRYKNANQTGVTCLGIKMPGRICCIIERCKFCFYVCVSNLGSLLMYGSGFNDHSDITLKNNSCHNQCLEEESIAAYYLYTCNYVQNNCEFSIFLVLFNF